MEKLLESPRTCCDTIYASVSRLFHFDFRDGYGSRYGKGMKFILQSVFVSLLLVSATSSTLADPSNGGGFNGGNTSNGGVTTSLPDSGPSFLLLALGCAGLAIAGRKRFKQA